MITIDYIERGGGTKNLKSDYVILEQPLTYAAHILDRLSSMVCGSLAAPCNSRYRKSQCKASTTGCMVQADSVQLILNGLIKKAEKKLELL